MEWNLCFSVVYTKMDVYREEFYPNKHTKGRILC